MAINFPKKQEVQLENAPLEEVICQVKFPPILRISQEIPIDFQDAIRHQFPGLKIEAGISFNIPSQDKSQEQPFEFTPRMYRFLSADEKSHVVLTADFFALSNKAYTHWPDFLKIFSDVEKTIINIFQIPYSTRIGLRFVNKFTKENTGCNSMQEILHLFRDELTCLLKVDVWNEPDDLFTQIVLNDEPRKFAFRFRFWREEREPNILLDLDYYEEGQLDLSTSIQRIEGYHNAIYDAFRWSLKDDSLIKFQAVSGK